MYFTTIETVYQSSDEFLSLETPTVELSVKSDLYILSKKLNSLSENGGSL